MKLLHDFRKSTAGATAIEYSLIASLIAIGIVSALQAIGAELLVPFQAVVAGFQGNQ